jgi:hypothetical protein
MRFMDRSDLPGLYIFLEIPKFSIYWTYTRRWGIDKWPHRIYIDLGHLTIELGG